MKSSREFLFSILIRAWRPMSHLLSPVERARIDAYQREGKRWSPVFIVGPPRCGSTFTYQLLTENLLFEYIDNLGHAMHRTLYLGNRTSHFFFDDKGHGSFSSKGGRTVHEGWHAPSECPPFWNRFIQSDSPLVGPDDIDDHSKERLKGTLRAIMGKNQRPLLIKNLRSIERLELIKGLFPDARFLVIRRDRLRTALSILRQRKALGIPDGEWWSARPPNSTSIEQLPVQEKVAAQVHYIEKAIEEGLKEFPSGQKEELHYERLMEDPEGEIRRLKGGFLQNLDRRYERFHIPEKGGKGHNIPKRELDMVKEGFIKLGLPYG